MRVIGINASPRKKAVTIIGIPPVFFKFIKILDCCLFWVKNKEYNNYSLMKGMVSKQQNTAIEYQ